MADTEGEGPSEPLMLNEIELVFKPHPTEMAGDNSLIKALKENCIRYIKTTANATGNLEKSNCRIFLQQRYIFFTRWFNKFYSRSSQQIFSDAFNPRPRHRAIRIR